jgi:epoxyqueuosine reductase
MTDDRGALKAKIISRAHELGFVRCGVARVEPLGREAEALRRWIARGYHASMGWMADTLEVRLDPSSERMLAGARSVIVLAAPFARESGSQGPAPGIVARYARGRDYHNVLGKRARKIAELVRREGHAARTSVDSVPVLERAWAQRAGVGFVGKNCCVIVPGLGSHVFLATVITDAELEPDAEMKERCGSCRLCLDGCPTRALTQERELDSARCISYLTIEHRGAIDPSLRDAIGAHLFGCDDCQDVCPFNRAAPPPSEETEPFASGPHLSIDASAILSMDEAAFAAWAQGTPLKRARREGLARNAAIVLGNAGDRRRLPVLREAAASHDSEVVRDAARWAIEKLED